MDNKLEHIPNVSKFVEAIMPKGREVRKEQGFQKHADHLGSTTGNKGS